MRKDNRKYFKTENGVTLIALAVTLIVLVILTGASASALFKKNGLIKRTKNATQMYTKEKARETLDIILDSALMKKFKQGLTEEELDEMLNEIGNVDGSTVTIEGWVFEIDREELEIIKELDDESGIIIAYTITGNENWIQGTTRDISIDVTIKNNRETLDTRKIVITENGKDITGSVSIKDGKFTLATNKATTYIVTASNSEGKTATRTIVADLKVDNIAPTVEPVVSANGMTIRVGARGVDNESGIKNFTYSITPTEGILEGKTGGTFKAGEIVEVKSNLERTYTVTITATDNVGNIGNKSASGEVAMASVTTVEGLTIAEAKRIINSSNYAQYIGTKVNDYKPEAGGIWRVFYYDSNNYFGDGTGTLYLKMDYGSDKEGMYDTATADATRATTTLRKLNPMWRDESNYKGEISLTNTNDLAILCDTEVWKKYCNNSVAKYAVGGPSLEMYIRVYNAAQQLEPGYNVTVSSGRSNAYYDSSMILPDGSTASTFGNVSESTEPFTPKLGSREYVHLSSPYDERSNTFSIDYYGTLSNRGTHYGWVTVALK